MKRLKFVSCLFVLVHALAHMSFANDLETSLEGHWVRVIPEVLNYVDDKTFENISVYTDQNDYAVFDIVKDNSETSVLCHYHIDNDSSHCDLVANGYEQTGHFDLVVSVSQDDIYQLLNQSGISMDVVGDPVWPWVVGAIVSYYAAKKAINYWIHKTFTPKPHVHTQFFIPKEDLENRNLDLQSESEGRLEKLSDITTSVAQPSALVFKGAMINALLEQKVLSLTQGLVTDVTHFCNVCNTTHSGSDTHFDLSASFTKHQTRFSPQFDFEMNSNDALKNQFHTLIENQKSIKESRFENAKTMISEGLIFRTTKAVLLDLKKELVTPIVVIIEGAKKVVTDKQSLKQLNAFVQTSFNASLGESNYMTASSIALSLVTIKVLGESIESIFVGPYHILCQVSDAAVVAAGLGMFSAYHCLRQPFRKKDPGLLLQSNFWSVLWSKIKNPIKSKVKSQEEISKMDAEQILLMEVDNIKSNIKRLIWQLRSEDKLNSRDANVLARDLGQVNKDLENLLFDQKLNLENSSLGSFVLMLKPIITNYKNIYEQLLSRIESKSNMSFEYQNSCFSYLQGLN